MCSEVLKFRPALGHVKDAASQEADVVPNGASAICTDAGHERIDTSKQVFWCGASGTRYVHTVHSLIECPEISDANYLLVRIAKNGRRTVLAAGFAGASAPSLNLAEVRRVGATLGANEVHVHFLASGDKNAKVIAHDLREAHLNETLPSRSNVCH